jgi:hypothetical protein
MLGACVSSLLLCQRHCPELVAVETTMIDAEAEAEEHRTVKRRAMLEMQQRQQQENL